MAFDFRKKIIYHIFKFHPRRHHRHDKMRENVRDMRGMFAEDSWPILLACCRYELARSVPLLQHLPLAAELQVLREKLEALLQGRLLQVRKFFEIQSSIRNLKELRTHTKPFHSLHQNFRNEVQSVLRENRSRRVGDASPRRLRLSRQLLRVLQLQSTAAERRAVCISRWAVDLPDGPREGVILVAIIWRRLHYWRPRENSRRSKGPQETANYSDVVATPAVQSFIRPVTKALPQSQRGFSQRHGADGASSPGVVSKSTRENEESSKEVEGWRERKR